MKKFIAALLCLIMLLSLFSCNNDETRTNGDNNDTTTNSDTSAETSDEVETTDKIENIDKIECSNYSKILYMCCYAVEFLSKYNGYDIDSLCAELGIADEEEKNLIKSIFFAFFDFIPSPPYELSCGYALKDLNGDGIDELILMNKDYYIGAIFSYADEKPVLLGNYWPRNSCWIDGEGLLHINATGGADHSTNAIYKIADGGKKLELIDEFGTDGHYWVGDVAYTIYYKLVNDEKISITKSECNALTEQYGKYLGSVAGAEATKQHSGLSFTSIYTYTESEIALEMYEAVLRNRCMVYEPDTREYNYLADCRTPYNRIPLSDCRQLKYAYTDMDSDGINELIIDCGDTLILHYYKGTVYAYSFTFRNLYYLNTDGSYSWNHTGENFEYGKEQIYFEGAELKTRELYRIVNDGEPNAEYYVEGKQVTQEELQKYIKDNPKTKIEFSEFDLTLSAEQAWRLANEYWDNQDGRKESAAGAVFTARIVLIDTPNPETNCYRFAFQVEWTSNIRDDEEGDVPYHINSHDEILVNAFTGEITPSSYTPGGKALSVEDAIEVVKNKFFEEETHKEDNYCFEYAINAITPDHIYEITIQKVMDQYAVFYTSEWVDKYSGEIIQGYYLYGKG